MKTKQKGCCPFCGEAVSPIVVEENSFRRDRCKCPKCEATVFLCRSPGCHNYAKGTDTYDHELCPACTEAAVELGSKIASTLLDVGKTVAVKALSDKVKAPSKAPTRKRRS